MKKLSSIVIAVVFLFSGSVFSQNKIVKSIQQKFNSLNDITATYSQYNGKTLIASGTFSYKKDGKVRLTMANNLIISDGSTTWNIDKKQKKVIITKVDKKSVSLLSLNGIVNNTPNDCDITEINKDKVKMTPKKGKILGFKSVELTRDSQNLLSSVTMEDNTKSVIRIDFSGYSLNKNLSESDFTYKPSGDYKVVDLR
jgi:outer membrane lipoprotein-sorting protein